ncbi:hypothetical protein QYM36_009021 [Artemia franciscana]|uniref:Uncharacterized protein n=1 Tax=Artemia franciscana TaxID=6661 RepID=A0AA88HV22_ARTSF|nr:hypothetical protein QYM36_009021 [Artemia franciscana]
MWVKLDHNARWQKALILEKYEYAPRSYILQTESGKVHRQNRQQIRERNQSMSTKLHFEAMSPEPGDQPNVSPQAQIGIEHPHSIPSSPTNFPTPLCATATPTKRFATPPADAATAVSFPIPFTPNPMTKTAPTWHHVFWANYKATHQAQPLM